MPQSLAQIYLQVVFSTKDRRPFLKDAARRARLPAYLGGTCKNLKSPAVTIGGVEDHVHVLCQLGRQITVADLVRELKRESSKWVKEQSPGLRGFRWQDGYGAFSVSPSHVDPLVTYIARQERRHRRETFQEAASHLKRTRNWSW